MTHSHVAAIEAREQRIAHLERRLVDRENTVSLMADELAFVALEAARLRRENEALRRPVDRRPWATHVAALEHKGVSPFELHPIDIERRP